MRRVRQVSFAVALSMTLAVGVWSQATVSSQDSQDEIDWDKVAEMLEAIAYQTESSFFSGTPQEVRARIDNLELVENQPVETQVYVDKDGRMIKESSQILLTFSPDFHQVFALTVTCSGACTGNGCETGGCDIVAGNCSACNCTGAGCTAQCTCTKTSTFTPKGGGEQ